MLPGELDHRLLFAAVVTRGTPYVRCSLCKTFTDDLIQGVRCSPSSLHPWSLTRNTVV
jgi:hypothetical protein